MFKLVSSWETNWQWTFTLSSNETSFGKVIVHYKIIEVLIRNYKLILNFFQIALDFFLSGVLSCSSNSRAISHLKDNSFRFLNISVKKLFKIKNRTLMPQKNRMAIDKTISDYLHNSRQYEFPDSCRLFAALLFGR